MSAPLKQLIRRQPCPTMRLSSTSFRASTASFSSASRRSLCVAKTPFRSVQASSSPSSRLTLTGQQFIRQEHNLSSATQHNTLDANQKQTAASAAAPNSARPTASTPSLDWNTFFKLRLNRRRIQLLFSVTSSVVGVTIGAGVLSTGAAEPWVAQVPLDPFVTLGLMTMACGVFGWLLGPIVGSQVFYTWNRRLAAQIKTKESEFLTRVKKNRVDPSNSSAGNPVPDFYGEKIQSVHGYRQWLKDQRAFNRKKTQAFL